MGRAATTGGGGAGQLNEAIITYLGNLSMVNYKWFRCYGIDDGKVETRNLKGETGRAKRVKPRTLCKTNPQRVRHARSEEHTSELQSRPHLVCRLLLEKKKQILKMLDNILIED